MKREDVPQDAAILDQWHEIAYALDEQGRYVLAPSAGWDAANVANRQAWEVIAEQVEQAAEAVRQGKASPLVFHMARFQMDAGLLASYARVARWRVKRHLRPEIYARLNSELRDRYARVFSLTPAELDAVPEKPEVPLSQGSEGGKEQL